MRRTLHALSVAALAGPALLGLAPAVSAEPAAEVAPATVRPGGTLTISVTCDPTGGPPPMTVDATSQAFEEGTVALHKVTGNDDELSGPAYRGTALIASAENFEGDPDASGEDSAWTVDGTCPAAPGGEGKPWSATFTVTHGTHPHPPSHRPGHKPPHHPCPEPTHHREPRPTACAEAPVQRGVRAGDGGAFSDSVPALVAGGVLIAGALGAAVHRLRNRESGTHP
ncbi:hypothetical protein SUDANB108_05926 [Streptomyces sp. enrichment culture]|uniref:hypothetical protein n=1 Tax=Streptomyces sp. enrichment culture TaxID=1795815 RepID=UPI003F55F3C2